MSTKELELLCEKNRKRLVEVVYNAHAGHIGGDLSCLNVMTALYFEVMRNISPANPKNPDRDRFVLSKGHCVEALYVTLEAKGFLKENFIEGMACKGGCIGGAGVLTHGDKNKAKVDEYGKQAFEKKILDATAVLDV